MLSRLAIIMFGIGRRPGEGLRCASSSADQTSRAICTITTEAVHRRMWQQLRTGFTQHVPSIHFIRGYRRLCATAHARTHAAAAGATEEQHRKLGKPQPCTAATADTVLIVESPTKAHKIQKYLGSAFQVLASYGHIRDLVPKAGAVDPSANFKMTWAVAEGAKPRLNAIKQALRQTGIKRLVLATDPDREGEAIAWHLSEILKTDMKGKAVERITFTEVTKKAVEEALHNPRDISDALVESYKGRRGLDFLVGFGISPVLWSKMVGSRSAGRVQSVALRLLAEREAETEAFKPDEWWSVDVMLTDANGKPFKAHVTHIDGRKVQKLDLKTEEEAQALAKRIAAASLQVTGRQVSEVRRSPALPYMTSSLLTDAANQLGSSVAATMSNAQALFEGGTGEGLITYMRTDSPSLDEDSAQRLCDAVAAIFGEDFPADAPRLYKGKKKNAQEGHGAVAPVDPMIVPEEIFTHMQKVKGATPTPSELTMGQKKLYELIWRRTLASQMAPSKLSQISVEISGADGEVKLRAAGSQIQFAGYLRAFENFNTGQEAASGQTGGRDEEEEEDEGRVDEELQSMTRGTGRRREQEQQARLLSNLKAHDPLDVQDVPTRQHFSQAPPRYTEAQLVKTLQEMGIGRPSTYAPIISVLQERGYVVKEGRALRATSRGRVLSAFLQQYFTQYVDYSFTSDMEAQLDDIAAGRAGHAALLGQFWPPFEAGLQARKDVPVRDIIDVLDTTLAAHFFVTLPGQTEEEARACPACAQRAQQGRLGLKLSKSGGFIGCSSYPECKYTRPLELAQAEGESSSSDSSSSLPGEEDVEKPFPGLSEGPVTLGRHPDTGEDIVLKQGRYGTYLQLGTDDSPSAVRKPRKGTRRVAAKKTAAKAKLTAKTATLKGVNLKELDLERAVELLKWPLLLGEHDVLKEPVLLHHRKFGFYVQVGHINAPLPKEMDPNHVDIHQACQVLDAKSPPAAGNLQGSSAGQPGTPATGSNKPSDAQSGADGSDSQSGMAGVDRAGVDRAGMNKTGVDRAHSKSDSRSDLKLKTASLSKDEPAREAKERGKGRAARAGKPAAKAATKPKAKSVSTVKGAGSGTSRNTPVSGYRLFWRQQWEKLKSQDPSITMTDATKRISQDWKQLDSATKNTFN